MHIGSRRNYYALHFLRCLNDPCWSQTSLFSGLSAPQIYHIVYVSADKLEITQQKCQIKFEVIQERCQNYIIVLLRALTS